MKKKIMFLLYLVISGGIILLACEIDHGLEPLRSGFSGTIHYSNAWPESISEVRIVTTYVSFDELLDSISKGDITKLLFSDPLPTYVDSCKYQFRTKPATYTAVILTAKKADEPWSEKSILAVYPNILAPKAVVVPDRDTVVENVDMFVRFN